MPRTGLHPHSLPIAALADPGAHPATALILCQHRASPLEAPCLPAPVHTLGHPYFSMLANVFYHRCMDLGPSLA
jgi:hypothetical protein